MLYGCTDADAAEAVRAGTRGASGFRSLASRRNVPRKIRWSGAVEAKVNDRGAQPPPRVLRHTPLKENRGATTRLA